METNEFEEQVDRDNPSNRKDIKTIGWGELSKLFLGAFTLYAIASHIFCPFTRSVNIYDPLIIYFVQFLFIYLFVSVPTVIIARVISKYRSIPMTELLYKTLLPTLIIGGILIYGGWYADNKMAGASRQSVEEGPRIAFSREGVRIDDKLVPLPCSLDQLSTALGKPSRRLLLANTILVWDRSGIMAYVKPGANNAQSISIAFWPTEYKYWPRTCFCDNVEIGTSFLNRKSKGSNLRAIGFVQNPMVPFYWERQFGSLLLTAETDLKGTKVVDVSLGVPMKKLSRRK